MRITNTFASEKRFFFQEHAVQWPGGTPEEAKEYIRLGIRAHQAPFLWRLSKKVQQRTGGGVGQNGAGIQNMCSSSPQPLPQHYFARCVSLMRC